MGEATDQKSGGRFFGLAERSPKPIESLMVKVGCVLGSCPGKRTNEAELVRSGTTVAEFKMCGFSPSFTQGFSQSFTHPRVVLVKFLSVSLLYGNRLASSVEAGGA